MSIRKTNTLLQQGDNFFRTRDTRLASCMLTMGFTLWKKQPYVLQEDVQSGQQQITWNIERVSRCGRFNTLAVSKAYKDPNVFKSEKPEAIALSQCLGALKNRELLIDICNNAEPTLRGWRDDGNLWYVPANSEEGIEWRKELGNE